jgi:hypothetical protein
MLWRFCFRKGSVDVSTGAGLEPGFHLVVEPAEVGSAHDLKAVQRAIIGTIGRGNPRVPAPNRAKSQNPAVLGYSDVKSSSGFERNVENWTLVDRNGCYQAVAEASGQGLGV